MTHVPYKGVVTIPHACLAVYSSPRKARYTGHNFAYACTGVFGSVYPCWGHNRGHKRTSESYHGTPAALSTHRKSDQSAEA
jgi:hypothetical protein